MSGYFLSVGYSAYSSDDSATTTIRKLDSFLASNRTESLSYNLRTYHVSGVEGINHHAARGPSCIMWIVTLVNVGHHRWPINEILLKQNQRIVGLKTKKKLPIKHFALLIKYWQSKSEKFYVWSGKAFQGKAC